MPRVFGEITGVPEGAVFENRAALLRAGVHGQMMGGIAGLASMGAESIVVSGGYEDDEDHGDWLIYTGQGGNDPKTGKQVADQALVSGNQALVKSRLEGLPVRVVRGAKHYSPYSPSFGYKYDGLFCVEDQWHEVGKSGFLIWRFRLQKIEPTRASSNIKTVQEEKQPYLSSVERKQDTVSRIIRNTSVANQVKQLHTHTCQICGTRLMTPAGPYAEAAHIQPLGKPHNGPDVAENILCLCPNDHLLFDMGALTINDAFVVQERGTLLHMVEGHAVGVDFVRYHRAHYALLSEHTASSTE